MAILALCELADGRRALLIAVDAQDRAQLAESRGAWTDVLVKDQATVGGVQMVGLIPCEAGDFLDLVFKLESQGLGTGERKAH